MRDRVLLLITGIAAAAIGWLTIHTLGNYWIYIVYTALAGLVYSAVRDRIRKRRKQK